MLLRPGKLDDYQGFLQAEIAAWQGVETILISFEQFSTWLRVHPMGLILAEEEGAICGHIFTQLCNYDPYASRSEASWDQMTDKGFCVSTHIPEGSTSYIVSISASLPGAGKKLVRAALQQAQSANLRYYVGACRIPGLRTYAEELGLPINFRVASAYALAVYRRVKHRVPGPVDPILTVFTSIQAIEFIKVIEGYFPDTASGDFAALAGCRLALR